MTLSRYFHDQTRAFTVYLLTHLTQHSLTTHLYIILHASDPGSILRIWFISTCYCSKADVMASWHNGLWPRGLRPFHWDKRTFANYFIWMFVTTCSGPQTYSQKVYVLLVCLSESCSHLNISFIRDGMLSKSLERENFDNILANPNESDFSIFISNACI